MLLPPRRRCWLPLLHHMTLRNSLKQDSTHSPFCNEYLFLFPFKPFNTFLFRFFVTVIPTRTFRTSIKGIRPPSVESWSTHVKQIDDKHMNERVRPRPAALRAPNWAERCHHVSGVCDLGSVFMVQPWSSADHLICVELYHYSAAHPNGRDNWPQASAMREWSDQWWWPIPAALQDDATWSCSHRLWCNINGKLEDCSAQQWQCNSSNDRMYIWRLAERVSKDLPGNGSCECRWCGLS